MKLKFNINTKFGRNRGRISSYHRGGGVKKLYRVVDFWRYLENIEGQVVSVEKDPYRTGHVALVCFSNGVLAYNLSSDSLEVGNLFCNYGAIKRGSVKNASGSSYLLKNVSEGERIYNLEFSPRKGGKIGRSAGTFCIVVKKYKKSALIKMVSGEYRLFSLECRCNIGRVSNIGHKDRVLGKAGVNRLLGKRPIVRGRAMNPVDHPHGGRTNGGITPKTPWGAIAIGVKTRKKKLPAVVIQRRKK